MDLSMIYFVFSAHILGIFAGVLKDTVVIGVIEHGPKRVFTETIHEHGYTVELQTYSIDMTDTYQVYKTVRLLDNSTQFDLVVFMNNDIMDISNPHIIQFTNHNVTFWGRKPPFALQGVKRYNQTTDGTTPMCPLKEVRQSRPYCIHHLSDITQTSNGTRLDKVTMDAPSIIASLVIKKLLWKHVIIFHENNTEHDVTRLVDNLSHNGSLFALYNIDNLPEASDLDHVLSETFNKTMAFMSGIHYIVMCQFGCLRRLFAAANTFDDNHRNKTLQKQFSQWLVVSYDHTITVSKTLELCAEQLDNVAVISLPEVSTENSKQGFYVALDTALNFKRLGFDNLTLLEHVLYRVKQQSTSWHPVLTNCEAIKIETLMYTSHGRRFDMVGYITIETGDVVFMADVFPNHKYGYNKRKFLVSTLHYPPFVIKREENGTVIYEGMCHDLLAELARTLNFTYELTEPADKKWGSPDDNLTFNGLIGQLQREDNCRVVRKVPFGMKLIHQKTQEVDIVAADISIQKEREMVMDFAFPFYYGDTSVLLKKPDPNEGKWRTLVDPFKWRVLVAIGAMLPLASLLAFLLERFNPFFDHPDNAQLSENCGLKTYIDSFWYMYGALLCQGGVNLPESFAGRTFVSSWWIFSIIIVGIYCGNLIAFLTLSKDKPPFNTLDEMAEMSNSYKWGTQSGTHWEFVFVNSQTAEFRKVGDLMIDFNRTDPSVMSVDVDVHLDKVKEGGYGWIGDTVIIEVEIAKNCELMMIKERFLPLKYAFGFTNNSPHTRIFSEQMLSIHESGLLQVWKRKWWPKNSICSGSIVPEAKPIKLVDVQSAFYVAAGGIVLAFISFVSEVAVGKYRKKNNVIRKDFITTVSVTDGDQGETE